MMRTGGELPKNAGTGPSLTERVRALRQQAGGLPRSADPMTAVEPRELARVINGVLDEIERLVHEVAGVGDDIAHELRTPLTRTRAILERGASSARTLEALQTVVDRAIGGLDRAIAVITALLRIAEIEHRRRLDGFGEMSLASIVGEVAELFQPIAEDSNVALDVKVSVADAAPPRGDRDLLFEAVANLVDNAIKFTPAGGRVELALIRRGDAWAIRVADSGPGIPEAERDAVTRRFYRADKSRSTKGLGLGLTLVAAIAKLHGFQLSIGGGSGCVVELVCLREAGA
jgi:signal transduction histidine kinase